MVAALEAGRALLSGQPSSRGGGVSAEAETSAGQPDQTDGPAETAGPPCNVDALLLMAETLLDRPPAEQRGPERCQLVVHVDAAALAVPAARSDGPAEAGCQLDSGEALEPETARRLACDASVVRILERDGRPLSVGRRTRSIPTALRRALQTRDRCCRFPGCTQRHFLHAHHLRHWAHGGPTELANLIQLCRHHHKLVHEGGYSAETAPDQTLRFRRPDRTPIPTRPKPPAATPTPSRHTTTTDTRPHPNAPAGTAPHSTCHSPSTH